jgi:hypothetical protein
LSGYNFDDQEDEGIFADDPAAAAGDPDAKYDMEQQSWVPNIALGVGPDGLVKMPPDDGQRSILDAPLPVSGENFICLAGPCSHYTENARLVPEGPELGAESNIEVGRWCGRIRTWAEQLDLTEAEIYACNCYDPPKAGWLKKDPNKKARARNQKTLAEIAQQEVEEKVFVGICSVGPCEHYAELIVKTPVEDTAESRRFCVRLGGLGRLYDLREKPVVVCSGWSPITKTAAVKQAAIENSKNIDKYRKAMAERKEEDDG